MSRRSSQAIWTEAEALERAGKKREALDLFVRAASTEDRSRPMHARHLWEQIADKFGTSPSLVERLASASERAELNDDAYYYWLAAMLSYENAGRDRDAQHARERVESLAQKRRQGAPIPQHARRWIDDNREKLGNLLETGEQVKSD